MALQPRPMSTRALLRAFQRARTELPGEEMEESLWFVQAKDLDLSVRHGALLAFNALVATAAINPIAASPGSPLSLDAPKQPWEVAAVLAGVLLALVAGILSVRAMMRGEEFPIEGVGESSEAFAQRLLAAYCTSVDHQIAALNTAARCKVAAVLATVAAWLWIIADKLPA